MDISVNRQTLEGIYNSYDSGMLSEKGGKDYSGDVAMNDYSNMATYQETYDPLDELGLSINP